MSRRDAADMDLAHRITARLESIKHTVDELIVNGDADGQDALELETAVELLQEAAGRLALRVKEEV